MKRPDACEGIRSCWRLGLSRFCWTTIIGHRAAANGLHYALGFATVVDDVQFYYCGADEGAFGVFLADFNVVG